MITQLGKSIEMFTLIFERESRKDKFEIEFQGIKTVPIFEGDEKGIKQGKRTAMC